MTDPDSQRFDRGGRWAAFLRSPSGRRLLVGSPLRRKGPALVVVGFLTIALGISLVETGAMFAAMEPAWTAVFLRALSLSALASVVPLAIVSVLDRRERESPWLVMIALFWGAVIATGLALPANSVAYAVVEAWVRGNPAIRIALGEDAAMLISAPLSAPIVEELTKGIALVALFGLLRGEFDNMRDGLVYGAIVGIGFNCLETPLYVTSGFAEDGVARWGLQFGTRFALLGLGGHALFSGLFGASLGLARQTRKRAVRVLAPFAGLLLAVLAHAGYNGIPLILIASGVVSPESASNPASPPSGDSAFWPTWVGWSVASFVLFFPFVAVQLLALWRSGIWERRVISTELDDEPGDIVASGERDALSVGGILTTRTIPDLPAAVSSALVNAQNELAFRKWHVRSRGDDPAVDPIAEGWRAEIRQLRGTASRTPADESA